MRNEKSKNVDALLNPIAKNIKRGFYKNPPYKSVSIVNNDDWTTSTRVPSNDDGSVDETIRIIK